MDWQLTCRVCLETGDMVSLFDWDENNEQLADKYTFCCGVEVAKKDTLPTLICLNCVDRLTFSYQFKQQCLSSNDTLKECLDEFLKTSTAVPETSRQGTDTETITIKQENGMLLQYELPVEHDPQTTWTNTKEPSSSNSVVSKAPLPKKRGRPRKYPNEQGQIHVSPYQRKKPKQPQVEEEALTTLLATGNIDMKQEPDDEFDNEELGAGGVDDDDPDFNPEEHGQEDIMEPPKKKRGRPRKIREEKEKSDEEENNGEDMLLKETIMAFSEPIPDHILNPKPKKKYPKKKYHYEKTHVCETCGSAFTSNASLQAHIRRHLGIKPFVCSVCGYSANASLTLRRHMIRKHTNERNYPCRHCDRRFVEYGDRQKHEWLHMGVRPYKCTLCTKSFTYSYVLANHMLTHTGEKKFSCEPCNRKFTKSHHLKYHNKVHHKELYIQQQLEQDAKKMRQQINVNNLSEVLSGTIVDGSLRLGSQAEEESEEGQRNLVVQGDFQEENQEDDEGKETDRAVAGMQEVMMGSDYEIEEDIKPE